MDMRNTIRRIISVDNPEIKTVTELHSPKGRTAHKRFIAQGLRTCATIIESGLKPVQLYTTEDQLSDAQAIAPDALICLINNRILEKISTTSTPSGIVGVFDIPQQLTTKSITAGIVLARISDPGNMGTLIRSAVAMGIKTAVVVEGTDPWSPKVIQATAGTITSLRIFELPWKALVENKRALTLCALVVHDGEKPSSALAKNTLLVVGNEAHGIPEEWVRDCEKKMTIPMPGNAESLNAAVAGAIAMYEVFVK